MNKGEIYRHSLYSDVTIEIGDELLPNLLRIGIRINGSEVMNLFGDKGQIESILLADYQKSEPKGGEIV